MGSVAIPGGGGKWGVFPLPFRTHHSALESVRLRPKVPRKKKDVAGDIEWYLISIDRLKQIGLVILLVVLGVGVWLFWTNKEHNPRSMAESAIGPDGCTGGVAGRGDANATPPTAVAPTAPAAAPISPSTPRRVRLRSISFSTSFPP